MSLTIQREAGNVFVPYKFAHSYYTGCAENSTVTYVDSRYANEFAFSTAGKLQVRHAD